MVHVISTTPNNISLFTSRSSFITQKFRKSSSQALPVTKYILPLSTSFKLFPQFRLGHISQFHLKTRKISATSADVAVSEASSETPIKTPQIEESTVKSDETRNKRPRNVRKSEMPPVKNEELINGAIFTGKVRSIQPFGAFIDFGAFTDGLVHVSQLSDSFVKDINTVVSIGQEVKVKLVEANIETGRISLTMREKDDTTPRSSPGRSNQRKGDPKKVSKFSKGQDLKGTVKNLTRSGAFISLPEGEEGFLPSSEEVDEGFANIMGGSSLNIGDEINVRVLRINRGQVTLTMKKDEEIALLGSGINLGVVHTATNPFLLAFRSNKEISSFLDERVKSEEKVKVVVDEKTDEKTPEIKEQEDNLSEDVIVKDEVQIKTVEEEKEIASVVPEVSENQSEDVIAKDEVKIEEEKLVDSVPEVSENKSEDVVVKDEIQIETPEEDEIIASVVPEVSEVQSEDVIAKDEIQTETLEEAVPEVSEIQPEDVIAKDEVQIETPEEEKIVDSVPEVSENKSEDVIAKDEVQIEEVKENVSNTETIITQSPITEKEVTNTIVEVKEEQIKDTISPALVKQLRDETGAGMMDCKKALKESKGDITLAQEFLRKKGLSSADKKSSRVTAEGRIGSYIHDSRIGVLIEVNCETDFVSRGEIFKNLVEDLAMQVTAYPQVKYLNSQDVPLEIIKKEKEIEMQKEDLLSKPEQIREKIVDGRIKKRIDEQALLEQPYIKNDKIIVKDWIKQTISTIGENIKVKRFVRYNLGEGLEKKSQDFAAEVAAQTTVKSGPAITPLKEETGPLNDTVQKTVISAGLVKQLREETGAGMMDCKKALSESSGDIEKAQEYLRKKGLLTADKKSNRLASEGRIGSYIHDSRIGVLIEVNCETDFVGRSERFKELVDDLAMQVVASLTVKYVSIEDIPESVVKLEKEMEMGRDDLKNKPEGIREKIVEGRVLKRLGELALLEQVFIKDDKLLVKDLIKQTVAALGENIKLRRFCRFTLGESVDEEKKIGNEE